MKLNGITLLSHVKKAQSSTGSEMVSLRAANGRLYISSFNEGRNFVCAMPVESNDSWECSFRPADTFSRTLPQIVDLDCDGKSLSIKTATYAGKYPIEPYAKAVFPDVRAQQVSADQTNLLIAGLKLTDVGEFLSAPTFEFSFKDSFECACWDRVHFSYYTTKYSGEHLSAKMLATDIAALVLAVPEAKKFGAEEGIFLLQSSTTKFSIPGLQVEGSEGLAELSQIHQNFTKPACTVNPGELFMALYRAESACGSGQPVEMSVEKDRIKISATSSKGEYVEVIAADSVVKKGLKVKVDPATAMDVIRLTKVETAQFGVYESFVWLAAEMDNGGVHYMAVLTSQSESEGE